ncbi:MAG: DUF5309 family protein, partial [Rikenellaceae bacterium]
KVGLTPELLKEDISKTVTEMMPSRTPLDTITRNLKNRVPAKSQKIGYYQASYKPVKDYLDSTVSGAGSSSSTPASSFTYSTTELTSIFVQVTNPDIWRTCDTMLMRDLVLPGTKGSARIGSSGTHTEDVMFYVAKKDGYVFELIPVNGVMGSTSGSNSEKFVVPDFDSSVELIRMGQAKSELSISTDPFAIYPSLSWQYCQNFMAQIEESTFRRLTEKEVNWGFSNFEAVNILSMKMEMELSMLFGQDGEYTSGNDHTYFTRGITRDIENVLEYGTSTTGDRTISKSQYNSWLKEVFDGNNGSSSRILFAGSGLVESLSQVDEFYKGIGTVTKDLSLGVDIRRIDTYFGTLDIVLAPLFKEAGWEDCGVILDLEHITKHEFIPLSVTELDLKKSGQKNADARVIQEVSALTLKYPDCHAIIKPKA